MAGEALALLVGMHLLSESTNPWISFKNDLFLGLDIIAGLGLILVAATNRDARTSIVFYGSAFVSIAAHGYREWEYLARTSNMFCVNAPLFAMNNLKIIGLLIIVVGAMWLGIAPRS
jgi:hypothetical protein